MSNRTYNHPGYAQGVSATALRSLNPEQQIEVMRSWFSENYEDPAEHTPYESAEGGYIWIAGGPYDALEELQQEFEGSVPGPVIAQLAENLERRSSQWAKRSLSA